MSPSPDVADEAPPARFDTRSSRRDAEAPERRDAPAALGAFPSVRLRRGRQYPVVTPPRRRASPRRRRSDLAAVRDRGHEQARADRLHAGRRAAVDRQHRRQRRAGGGARHPGHRALPQHRAEAAHRGRARGVQSGEPRLPRDARREGRRPRHRHHPRRRARPLHQSRPRRPAARRRISPTTRRWKRWCASRWCRRKPAPTSLRRPT